MPQGVEKAFKKGKVEGNEMDVDAFFRQVGWSCWEGRWCMVGLGCSTQIHAHRCTPLFEHRKCVCSVAYLFECVLRLGCRSGGATRCSGKQITLLSMA